MRATFLALVFFALLGLGARDLGAQPYPYYDPYWDYQYQQYLQYQHYMQWQDYLAYLQQTDPYYELHLMHYQLYRWPYQPYQVYQPCCYAWGVAPYPSIPISPEPRRVAAPRGQAGYADRCEVTVRTVASLRLARPGEGVRDPGEVSRREVRGPDGRSGRGHAHAV